MVRLPLEESDIDIMVIDSNKIPNHGIRMQKAPPTSIDDVRFNAVRLKFAGPRDEVEELGRVYIFYHTTVQPRKI